MTEPIAALDDLDLDLCRRAFTGTSFVPERRADDRRASYVAHIEAVYAEIAALAGPDRADEARVAVERYRDGWLTRQRAHLQARTRVVSTMIAGASNFPVRRMEKINATVDRRLNELLDYERKALTALRKQFTPAPAPIDRAAQLAELEAKHARMLASNKAWKRRDAAALAELGHGANLIALWLGSNEPPYAAYTLTNSRARIKDLAAQITAESARATVADAFAPIDFPATDAHPAGTLAIEDERVVITFEERTSKAFYDRLRGAAFLWSPKRGAFVRKHTAAALAAAKTIVSL